MKVKELEKQHLFIYLMLICVFVNQGNYSLCDSFGVGLVCWGFSVARSVSPCQGR